MLESADLIQDWVKLISADPMNHVLMINIIKNVKRIENLKNDWTDLIWPIHLISIILSLADHDLDSSSTYAYSATYVLMEYGQQKEEECAHSA